MRRSSVMKALRIAVALALVGVLAWKAGVSDVGSRADALAWQWVLLAALLVPVSIGVRAYNHALLLNRPEKVLGFGDAYLLTLVGVGINLFIPTGAADLAKAGWGARMHGSPEAMVVSSVLDKLTSLTAVGILGLGASVLAREPLLAATAGLLSAVSFVPTVYSRAVPWRLMLKVLAPGAPVDAEVLRQVARPPAMVLSWVYAVSVVGWLLTYSVMWACCRAAGAAVSLQDVFAFAPLTSVARLLPISVGGIGVGEVTFAALLARTGVDGDIAALAVLVSMVLLVLAPGAAGALIVARGGSAKVSR